MAVLISHYLLNSGQQYMVRQNVLDQGMIHNVYKLDYISLEKYTLAKHSSYTVLST